MDKSAHLRGGGGHSTVMHTQGDKDTHSGGSYQFSLPALPWSILPRQTEDGLAQNSNLRGYGLRSLLQQRPCFTAAVLGERSTVGGRRGGCLRLGVCSFVALEGVAQVVLVVHVALRTQVVVEAHLALPTHAHDAVLLAAVADDVGVAHPCSARRGSWLGVSVMSHAAGTKLGGERAARGSRAHQGIHRRCLPCD